MRLGVQRAPRTVRAPAMPKRFRAGAAPGVAPGRVALRCSVGPPTAGKSGSAPVQGAHRHGEETAPSGGSAQGLHRSLPSGPSGRPPRRPHGGRTPHHRQGVRRPRSIGCAHPPGMRTRCSSSSRGAAPEPNPARSLTASAANRRKDDPHPVPRMPMVEPRHPVDWLAIPTAIVSQPVPDRPLPQCP